MTVLKAAAVVVGLFVVSGGALGAYAMSGGFQEPSLEDVDVRWGEVTQEVSEIRATVVVDNPNAIGIPGVIDIEYTARLNTVTIADGVKEDVGLSTGTNDIDLLLTIDNAKMGDWWVTHINGDEQSNLAIEATVNGPFGVSFALPTQTQSFSTDLLGPMNGDRSQTLSVSGNEIATITGTTASWGTATAQETPLNAEISLTNEREFVDVTVSDVSYTMMMNDVTVAEGTDPASVTLAPGESGALAVSLLIDSQKMDDWWVSHVENDETTTLSVSLTVTVEAGGETETVTIDTLGGGSTVSTDILAGTG